MLRATDIKWDLDREDNEDFDIFLPTEIDIPNGIGEDEVDEYLSDYTGFCHDGYVLTNVEETEGN